MLAPGGPLAYRSGMVEYDWTGWTEWRALLEVDLSAVPCGRNPPWNVSAETSGRAARAGTNQIARCPVSPEQ